MACGEFGPGRMSEVPQIIAAIEAALGTGPLSGRHVLVTSGPTHEPIDPVRYIANRSSGRAGHGAGRRASRPRRAGEFRHRTRRVPPPTGVDVIAVETAPRWPTPCARALPADAAVFAAAVADWRVENASGEKIKKDTDRQAALAELRREPRHPRLRAQMGGGRPALVVGFAAETQDVVRHATEKRAKKGCDWIVANDVSPGTGIMGGSENAVTLITDRWPRKLAAVEQVGDGPAAGGAHRRALA
jgi:phosphopantothenoylcysteine decarboxylase/phosphopantothenate--cysteine ligase